MNIKKSDWVICKSFPQVLGSVIRVSKDGSWADVEWNNGNTKRMKTTALEVQTTINVMGINITDVEREKELNNFKSN